MDIFSIFFNTKVRCVFSLESPIRSDFYEYTQYTIFTKKENRYKLSQICSYGIYSKGLKKQCGKRPISVRATESLQ